MINLRTTPEMVAKAQKPITITTIKYEGTTTEEYPEGLTIEQIKEKMVGAIVNQQMATCVVNGETFTSDSLDENILYQELIGVNKESYDDLFKKYCNNFFDNIDYEFNRKKAEEYASTADGIVDEYYEPAWNYLCDFCFGILSGRQMLDMTLDIIKTIKENGVDAAIRKYAQPKDEFMFYESVRPMVLSLCDEGYEFYIKTCVKTLDCNEYLHVDNALRVREIIREKKQQEGYGSR